MIKLKIFNFDKIKQKINLKLKNTNHLKKKKNLWKFYYRK